MKSPTFPYIAPFVLFMVFLALQDIHPSAPYWIYPIKTLAVGALILFVAPRLPSLRPTHLLLSTGVALVSIVVWVGLDPILVHRSGPPAGGFNPFQFENPAIAWTQLIFRITGATLVVPIMEEIFWRGFLMRYIIREDFEKVPLGTFQWLSFAVTTAAFASIHGPQWPLGVAVGLLFGGLFLYTKTLGSIIWAHGLTNLLLGLYVIRTGAWYFW